MILGTNLAREVPYFLVFLNNDNGPVILVMIGSPELISYINPKYLIILNISW